MDNTPDNTSSADAPTPTASIAPPNRLAELAEHFEGADESVDYCGRAAPKAEGRDFPIMCFPELYGVAPKAEGDPHSCRDPRYCPKCTDALAASAPVVQAAAGATGRTHELKTDPDVFQAVWDGRKTFEIRRDDREGGFQVGDALDLRETKFSGAQMHMGLPLIYTGRRLTKIVSHRLTGYGLSDHWVCLSFARPEADADRASGGGV